MQNSQELWAERKRLADTQAALVAEDKTDEAFVAEGQLKQLDITLEHVLEEEAKMRDALPAQATSTVVTLAESVLGPRNEFKGIHPGFKKIVDTDPTVVSVPAPREIELELPGKLATPFPGFASTLPSVPAKGTVDFKQRSAQHGEPDTWEGVVDGKSAIKPTIIYTYKDAVAHKETIAGVVPVSEDTLSDYPELSSIINSDLMLDVQTKRNAKYVKGTNQTGIVGIENTVGILGFDPTGIELVSQIGGVYYEAIRYMRNKVMTNAKRIPTHVCINPDVKLAIDLYKTTTGLYQVISGDVLWGMKVVEDIDCSGIIVYDCYAAKARPVHQLKVDVGYVNDQFYHNELSVRAEETSALQVNYPDAFCFASKEALDAKKPTAVASTANEGDQDGE